MNNFIDISKSNDRTYRDTTPQICEANRDAKYSLRTFLHMKETHWRRSDIGAQSELNMV